MARARWRVRQETELTTLVCVLLAAWLTAGILVIHSGRLAADPSRWPSDASFETQVRLAKRFLHRHGWTLGETTPWINVFVRANKGNAWLNLMVHGPETLSLPLLMRDCIDKSSAANVIVGILTRETLPDHLREDADRSGIYVIGPAELTDVETHIVKATARQTSLRDTAIAPAIRKTAAARATAG